MHFERPSILRVAAVNNPALVSGCVFEHVLPNSTTCPDPGVFMEVTIMILQMLVPNVRLKFFRVDYHSVTDKNSSSVIGAVMNGNADATPAYMTLMFGRAEKLSYVTPFLPEPLTYIYKPVEMTVTLDLEVLFPVPLLMICGFLGIVHYFGILLDNFFRNSESSRSIFDSKLLRQRLKLIIGFFFGLCLGIFSNIVCLKFNLPIPATPPFKDALSVAAKLSSGEYELVKKGESGYDIFFNHLVVSGVNDKHLLAKLTAATFYKGSLQDLLKLVQQSENPKKVAAIVNDLYSRRITCAGLEAVADYSATHLWNTIYIRNDLTIRKDLSQGQLKLLQAEYRRLLNKYQLTNCVKNADFKKRQLSHSVTLKQSIGAFVTFKIALSVSFAVFLAEIVFDKFKACLSTKAAENLLTELVQQAMVISITDFSGIKRKAEAQQTSEQQETTECTHL